MYGFVEADAAAIRDAALDNGFAELAVLGQHALHVGALPWHHRDPFDRLLVAQAAAECASAEIDNRCQTTQDLAMSRQTMSFALPESMREYIDSRVAAGNYGNTSEYIRDLVRRDQEEQARKRLRALIEEGLASGPGRRRTKADEKKLQAIASGDID